MLLCLGWLFSWLTWEEKNSATQTKKFSCALISLGRFAQLPFVFLRADFAPSSALVWFSNYWLTMWCAFPQNTKQAWEMRKIQLNVTKPAAKEKDYVWANGVPLWADGFPLSWCIPTVPCSAAPAVFCLDLTELRPAVFFFICGWLMAALYLEDHVSAWIAWQLLCRSILYLQLTFSFGQNKEDFWLLLK